MALETQKLQNRGVMYSSVDSKSLGGDSGQLFHEAAVVTVGLWWINYTTVSSDFTLMASGLLGT